jgi:hypothetical protein
MALFGANNTRIETEELNGDTQFVQSSFRATVDKIVAAASEPCEAPPGAAHVNPNR